MTGVSFDASEVHALAADIRHNADLVPERAQRIIEDTGHDVDATFEQLVPVRTGFDRESDGVTIGPLSFEAGPFADYGGYVELGTSDTTPQPALGPAFDLHLPRAVERLGDMAGGILE